jgi:hypothetical protein
MKISKLLFALCVTAAISNNSFAEEKIVPVHLQNINTVETALQLERYQKIAGGVNTFSHNREMVPIDKQTTIAMNRDTFYSLAVLNLSKPVTITLPEANGRYMALQIIDEDHYSPFVLDKPGKYVLTEDKVGTKFAFAMIRTFVDPNNPKDVEMVHKLQDAVKVEGGGTEPYVLPNYDMKTYKALFADIQKLIKYWNGDTRGSMGKRGELNELIHTVATMAGWGLNPPSAAMYAVVNDDFDPKNKYKIEVPADVPVKAFWSISIYNKDGFFGKNKQNAYTVNNVTGKKNKDGSTTIFLGACEDEKYNCLPLPGKGSYYEWRMYAPEQSVLDGKWHFPKHIEVK